HSVCRWAILPMQDWLELDASGRMNTPATVGSANWSWRLSSLKLEPWRIERLASLIRLTGR
ncbi:MAG TPA: 4-alpha-glucanotransferase, partial [Sphaerochaeta sp.]|nr:4-alpha-glucanotransferase [Sphaerochaeta sp.]